MLLRRWHGHRSNWNYCPRVLHAGRGAPIRNPIREWVQETLGVIPFTVSAAPQQQPVETPALTSAGMAALLLALIGTVLRNLRKRLA